MAVNKILFKKLPFQPKHNQVFYIENGYNGEVNDFIRGHFINLKSMFRKIGMDFNYLPYLLKEQDIEEKVRYYAPYLSPKLLVHKVQSNAFVPYILDSDAKANLKPSLIFDGRQDENSSNVSFLTIAFESNLNFNGAIIEQLIHLVLSTREAFYNEERKKHSIFDVFEENMAYEMSMSCPSATPNLFNSPVQACIEREERELRRGNKSSNKSEGLLSRLFNRIGMKASLCCEESDNEEIPQKTPEEIEEEQSLIETAKVLRELRITVQKLRLEGVSLMAIHEFIDKQEPLSRMTITTDYRIFLPEYNNMEIEMGALPKAIYFLYLRYPEGIIYKHMPDYFSELLNIYKQLRPNTDEARLHLTITKVVNPLGNALNENIARIRKAFVEKFDEHLANNYIITGERGLQYSIPLDRDLIEWEE